MNKKLNLIFTGLFILVTALIYFHTTDSFDQDLGRHLKLGEIIWQTKQVPKTNLFSYTNPNEPVFNSHWGSQVIFYGIHKAFGINGLILLNTIINTLACGLLGLLVVRRVGLLIPSLLFIPFVFLLLDRTWIRPEMFGNLFYAMLLIAIFSKRVRKYLKWFFPLLALLWINLHITAVFGVFVMGAVLFQDTLDVILGSAATPGSKKDSGQARMTMLTNAIITVLTVTALLINPYGIDGVRMAFTVLDKYGYTIVENQSWVFLRDFGFPIVSHIAIGLAVLILSYIFTIHRARRPILGELILLVVITVLTLRFVRNEILFAYTVFLIAAFNLGFTLKVHPEGKLGKIGILGILGSMIVGVIIIFSSHSQRGLPIGFGNQESYQNGVDFFLRNNLHGPIFNNFDIGGYLIYRLQSKSLPAGRQEKVFVDNRPEAYPVAFFEDIYKLMQVDQNIFDKFAKQYDIRTIIWGVRDITPWSQDFMARITKDPAWKIVYLDDTIIILVKNGK